MKFSDYCREMAFRLTIAHETVFRIKAYENAAKVLELAGDVEDVASLRGIGKSIASELAQVRETGTSDRLETMRAGGPPASLLELTAVRGIGIPRALEMHKIGISSLAQLGNAVATHRLQDPRLAAAYYDTIALSQCFRRDAAEKFLRSLAAKIAEVTGVLSLIPVGEYRLGFFVLHSLDILIAVRTSNVVKDVVSALGSVFPIRPIDGRTAVLDISIAGVVRAVSLHFCGWREFGYAELYFTGPRDFYAAVAAKYLSVGITLTPYCAVRDSVPNYVHQEVDVFRGASIPIVPAECRRRHLDVIAPLAGLVEDVVGDVHIHTVASDGSMSVHDVLMEAARRRYTFVGISDHSNGSGGGMHQEKACARAAQYRSMATNKSGVHLFAGVELDIKLDGALDYDVSALSSFDYVILAVHTNPTDDNIVRITQAFSAIRAMHPRLPLLLAHPTGRLIGSRAGSATQVRDLFVTCARYNVALEVNGQPSRADLSEEHLWIARQYKCRFLASSDAHALNHMGYVDNSVLVCRQALLQSNEVINATTGMTKRWLSGDDLRQI